MADRSVNININYKVNTADIQKAQVASKAAQTATDNLRKSASVYGASAVKAGNDAANAVKKVSEATKTATKDTDTLGKQFGNLTNYVKGFITLAIAKQLADVSIEALTLAGNVDSVKRAFQNQVPNSVSLLNRLRDATHGTVSDLELMQRALKAQNFGIDIQRLPELLEFAAIRAQQTGESVDYLVSSIVDGLGRKSLLKLDNLGISASRLKEEFKGASLASLSVGQVTEGVSNIIREETEKMGGYVETSATKVDQLKAGWENLKATLSKALTARIDIIINNKGESLTSKFFNRLAGSLKDAGEDVLDAIMGQDELIKLEAEKRASILVSAMIEGDEYKAFKENSEAKIKFLSLELVKQVEILNQRKESIKSLDKQIASQDASTMAGGAQIEKLNKIRTAQELDRQTRELSIDTLRKYILELRKLSEVKPDDSGIIQRKRDEIEQLDKLIEETNKLSDLGEQGTLIKKRNQAQKELDILEGKNKEIKKSDESVSEYLSYLSDLELFGVTEHLKERVKAREDAAKEEKRIEKEKEEAIRKERERQEKLTKQAYQTTIDGAIDLAASTANALVQIEADKYNRQINIVNDYYDNQIRLAGDNDKAKEQIERKREIALDKARRRAFEKNKEAQKIQAIINAAAAAARAFADYEYPVSIAIAALAGAEAAAQVAIISQQRANFKDGVIDLKGPGTTTSDSIPVNVSNHESIMTAKETFRAKGILEMIRGNKIDDRILKNLQLTASGVKYVGMSDERIVSAIKDQTYPDVVRIGNDLFDVKKSKDGISKSIRRKSMGNG